jgi:hypothetical protein
MFAWLTLAFDQPRLNEWKFFIIRLVAFGCRHVRDDVWIPLIIRFGYLQLIT